MYVFWLVIAAITRSPAGGDRVCRRRGPHARFGPMSHMPGDGRVDRPEGSASSQLSESLIPRIDRPGRAASSQLSTAFAGTMVWARSFPGRPDQAAQARRFVRFLLAGTSCADEAELIVSELAGNALRHTRSGGPGGRFIVEVTVARSPLPGRAGVLVAVHDEGGGDVPQAGAVDGDRAGVVDGDVEENGRGLAIVAAVAVRFGFQGSSVDGHTVWAYLRAEAGEGVSSY